MTSTVTAPARRGGPWWLLLVTGLLWIVIAAIVLRFNLTSVATIAVLAGVVVLLAALAEAYLTLAAPGWRWLHGLLTILFVASAIVIFIHPGQSFLWLAAFIGWFFLFKGLADITLAVFTRAENEAWWLQFFMGLVELGLGFWAAGRFQRSAYLLIVLVAAIALTRAVTDIVMAFRIRASTHQGPHAKAARPAAPRNSPRRTPREAA